jgi:uncharacterized protein
MPNHHQINYLEYAASNLEATKAFFCKVFAFEFIDYGPDYCSFSNDNIDGGFYRSEQSSSYQQGAPLTVFYSKDLEQTQSAIEQAGGDICKPIFTFPGGRRFHFKEPSGNEFAVWSE